MKIVFMGTPDFAASTLKALAASEHEVVAVYTRPDAVRRRGKTLEPSPVKVAALNHEIAIETPRSFYAADGVGTALRDVYGSRVIDTCELDQLSAYQPDIIVVSAYGLILPQAVLDLPRFGCINIHFSLLPRWRGAAPVQRAILAGDKEVGISIMRMSAGLDTGEYCLQHSLPIGSSSADELTSALANLGYTALMDALTAIDNGSVEWVLQDETLATYADKISKDDVLLSPELDAIANIRRVRVSSRRAPARARIAGRNVAITRAVLAPDAPNIAPGEIAVLEGKRLFLGTKSKVFEVLKLKPDSKGEMEATAFVAGNQNLRQATGACTTAPVWRAV